MVTPTEFVWAFIGLILTIGGTFAKASIMNLPWQWGEQGLHSVSLGVTWQIGAILFVSCTGGKNAGVLSQIAYLALGLAGFPVFAQGGGISYVRELSFGYILGFVPGAWICGTLAFQSRPSLGSLLWSCLWGLLMIHLTGLIYLTALYGLGWVKAAVSPWLQAAQQYSLHAVPGQLAIACAVAVLALFMRRLLFVE